MQSSFYCIDKGNKTKKNERKKERKKEKNNVQIGQSREVAKHVYDDDDR